MAETSQNKEKFNDYDGFVEKFKPKRTTDDCYTPPIVYDAIKDYFIHELHLKNRPIVRPFYPGGDYINFDYPPNCVVLDNPPFSIFSQIRDFYIKNKIDFILFCQHTTAFASARGTTVILTGAKIKYENGAIVNTAFSTNLLPDVAVWLNSDLKNIIKKVQHETKVQRTKHQYPENVISAALCDKYIRDGVMLKIPKSQCTFVRKIGDVGIFGGGLVLDSEIVKILSNILNGNIR